MKSMPLPDESDAATAVVPPSSSIPRRFAPRADKTTKPLRRSTAVDHNLRELSD